MYRPSGYNRIFCVAVSTEPRCFEMPSLPVETMKRVAHARDSRMEHLVDISRQRNAELYYVVYICVSIHLST